MKKLILILILIGNILITPSAKALTLGDYVFNPITFCVIPGGIAYSMSSNNQAMIAGAACAVGALLEYGMESVIKESATKGLLEENEDLKNQLRERETLDAIRSSEGEDETFSVKVKQRLPGYINERGEAVAPTWIEKLVMPGNGTLLGD